MDDLSNSILRELGNNARLSITEIGKRVGLSSPAVSERIRKMEDEGIITGYTAKINHSKIGLNVNAFITLKSGLARAVIAKRIEEVPEVIECYSITGSHCVIMKVVCSDTGRLESIIGILQQFGETNTSIILSEAFEKRGLYAKLT